MPLKDADTISAQWFRVEEAERPLGGFSLRHVPLVRNRVCGALTQFWPRCPRSLGVPRAADDVEEDIAFEPLAEDMDVDIFPGDPLEEAGVDDAGPSEFERLLDPLLDAYDMAMVAPDADVDVFPGHPASPDSTLREPAPPTPPLPPPLPDVGRAAPMPNRRRRRGGDEINVVLPNGEITYFNSNGNFEARCFAHADERCTLTRKGGYAAASSRVRQALRPLGLLAAWLDYSTISEDKQQHRDPASLRRLASAEERNYRYECRLALQELFGADALFDREGEAAGAVLDEEPETVR